MSNYVHLSTCHMYIHYYINFVHNSCQTMYIHYYICPPVMWRVTAVKLYTLLHLSTCHVESNSCQTMYICPPVICTYIITFVHNSCQTMYIHTLLHLSTCHVEGNSYQTMYIHYYICPPVMWRVTAVKLCTYIITFVHLSCGG